MFYAGESFKAPEYEVRPHSKSVKHDVIPLSDILKDMSGKQIEQQVEKAITVQEKRVRAKRQSGKKQNTKVKTKKKISVADRSDTIRKNMYSSGSKTLNTVSDN